MDSPQSVVSPFMSSILGDSEKQKSDVLTPTSGTSPLSKNVEVNEKEAVMSTLEDLIGVVDVYIHQARDIHNICIYHKQDVYAKICLTSNPENTVSTKIINGGGRNPVFNENLQLSVRSVDCAVKCEIWMLSRVKNYLEDQLLGFALVPLSEVLMKRDGKLTEKEFSLSSTDLFHSPAGFVQLSLAYTGASPDVMAISALPSSELAPNVNVKDSLATDLDKIEFPDPKIVNEDHLMASEYYGIPCETHCSDSLATSDEAENHSSEAGVRLVESFSACSVESVEPPIKVDSPPSSVSTNGVSSPSVPASSESSHAAAASAASAKSPNQEQVSGTKDQKSVDVKEGESHSSNGVPCDSYRKPVVSVSIVPEPKVVQQDIVDMYMKSMQQFTESLAKMKLPMDIESGPNGSGKSSSEQNLQASNNSSNSRVFYGSRAFF